MLARRRHLVRVRCTGGKAMGWRLWFAVLSLVACMVPLAVSSAQTGPTPRPEGTLTVAVATFGNERWLPELYPGAEDVVLKPMMENLLSRDVTTGQLTPMLAERWEVLDGGRTWKFSLRQGVLFTAVRSSPRRMSNTP